MVWQQNVSKVLSDLGWGSGFRLPISNAKNVALERELEKKQSEVSMRRAELAVATRQAELLEKGISSATDQISHENKLVIARRGEVEAEKEFIKLALNELKKSKREFDLTRAKLSEHQTRNEDMCAEIESRKQNLSDLVEITEYDRRELERLENIARDQDSYMKMLEELCQTDAETLKKFQGRYKSAGAALTVSRMELDRTISVTEASQRQFEFLSQRFRKLHDERCEIVEMWKNTLLSLQSRDGDMKGMAEEYTNVHKQLKAKEMELDSIKVSLDSTQRDTNRAEFELNRWDRKVGDLRAIIKDNQSLTQEYLDNLLAHETSLTLGSQAINDLKRKIGDIDKEMADMKNKRMAAESINAELKARLDMGKMDVLTVSERKKQITAMIEEEEKKVEDLKKTLEQHMSYKSLYSSKKTELIRNGLSLDHQIRGISTNIITITAQSSKADITLEKRKQMIYRFDVEYITVDSRLRATINPRVFNPHQYEIMENKIVELKKTLQDVIHNRSFVTVQTGHLDDINRRIYRERLTAIKELKGFQVAFNEYRAKTRFASKHLEQLETEVCDNVVQQSMVKLKLNQMQKSLKEHESLLYDAGHQRILLESMVREKRMELENYSRLLQAHIRGIREELSQYRVQLSHTKDDTQKRKIKYDWFMKTVGTPEYNDSDEIKSEAYYVLKFALEREELRREGDKWDKLVKEAEKETEGLQNSLRLMQCSNDLFKDSLKVVPDADYQSEMDKLKQKEIDLQDRKRKASKQLRLVQEEMETKIRNYHQIQRQIEHENELADKDHEHRLLQAEIRDQDQRIRRVHHLTLKLLSEISFSCKEEKDLVQLDIKLNAVKKKIDVSLMILTKLLNIFPNLREMVDIFLSKRCGPNFVRRVLKRVSPSSGKGEGSLPSRGTSPIVGSVRTLPSVSRKSSTFISKMSKHIQFEEPGGRTKSETELVEQIIKTVNEDRQQIRAEQKKEAERQEKIKAVEKALQSSKSILEKDNKSEDESPTVDTVFVPKQKRSSSVESVPSLDLIPPPSTPAPRKADLEALEKEEDTVEIPAGETTEEPKSATVELQQGQTEKAEKQQTSDPIEETSQKL